MIYPLVMMLILILFMFGLAFLARVHAAALGTVELKYYELFEGRPPPDYVIRISNNLNNLFEVPPIFLAAVVLAIALNIESATLLASAWGFVIARYIHTAVHVTYNRYLLRSAVFGISLLFLVVLWGELVARIA